MTTAATPAFASPAPRTGAPQRLRLVPLGMSLGLFLAISYTLCIALGLIEPDFGLHKPWLQFFPGFEWLTWRGFFIGLTESFVYGWYAALVFVPLHNFFNRMRG